MKQILQTMIKIQMPKLLHFFLIWGIFLKKNTWQIFLKIKNRQFYSDHYSWTLLAELFSIETTVSGTIGHACGASKIIFEDEADSDATDYDDVDDTDDTGEVITEPEVKTQLLLQNVMAVTTMGDY